VRGDDQAQLAELGAGQQPGQRGQHRPVGPQQPRVLDLALEHGQLMAQDEDFGVLGAVGAGEQGKLSARATAHAGEANATLDKPSYNSFSYLSIPWKAGSWRGASR
jgi:hypothetical protein